ncbi:DUF4403 family protein [Spirosoma fluviale]|uniref:DUF4403 family protein n=1 Tax=Spirosoma fluviale TaxID=1597977 RepID=A0A286GVJ4_9BACT|nr:DUF4403 family protein [Spirosoma fluviale]SOD99548.1 protein of unknown function [Spirosoma fluviale]
MRTLLRCRYFIGFGLLVLLAQCQKVKPEAPKAEGFDPPIAATLSYLAGSITFQLRELEEKINKELDPVLVGKETKDGKTRGIISFRVKRLGPVHVEYVDQQIKLSAPLQMWLTKPFSRDTTPPKKPFCALAVNFKSPVSVTPNWRLGSRTTFTDYKWIVQPQIAGISLTRIVQNILDRHKTDIEMAIDSAVHTQLRLDKMVKPIWRDLQSPLLINKEYGLWLTPIPISVAAGAITGNAEQITTHVRIAVRTQTELKPTKPVHTPTSLPPLQKRDTVPQTSDLHLMSFIPYADINRMLAVTTNSKNKKLVLGSLTIHEVSVYGGQRSLIVKADVSGLMDGTIYLRGRPEFDTLTNTLHIANLDFDAETWKALPKGSDTVWHKGLRELLESLLTIPLGDDIAKLPQAIDKAFEKGGPGKKTDLTIQSFRFVPQKIAIRPDGIQALIYVKSTVGVQVKQL